MKIRTEDGKMNSLFVCEKYLAAKVVFSDTPEDCRHAAFEYSDSDLLEFGLDRNSGLLKKMVLVLNNHFSICNTVLDAPTAPDCMLYCDLPREYYCDFFSTTIYANGLHLRLSTRKSTSYAACGDIVFGLDKHDELVDVFIKRLSREEVAHVIYELKA